MGTAILCRMGYRRMQRSFLDRWRACPDQNRVIARQPVRKDSMNMPELLKPRPGGDFGPDVHGGGSQGYSICVAVFTAISWPTSLSTTCKLMSMPAAIPAEQTTLPLSTKRRSA